MWRNLFHFNCCFLNKYSKGLFDYFLGIHRQKEDFSKKKRCNVPFELHKGMPKIIIIVKKYIYNFCYFQQEGKSLLQSLLSEGCHFQGGRYFGNFTVLLYKKLSQTGQYKTMSANITFSSSSPLLLPLHIFSFSCSNMIFNLVRDKNTLFWTYSSQITLV